MTKKGHQKLILADENLKKNFSGKGKIWKCFRENVKFGKFSTEFENF